MGVGDALERVGVGDVGQDAGADLGGELVEPVAARLHEHAVQVDVAVDRQVEVAGQVDDRRGVAADGHVGQGRLELSADQVDDSSERLAQRPLGVGRRPTARSGRARARRRAPRAGRRSSGREAAATRKPRRTGHLHQQVTDTTGRAVHEHPRPGDQRHPLQHLERRAPGQGQGRGDDRVQLRRAGRQQVLAGRRPARPARPGACAGRAAAPTPARRSRRPDRPARSPRRTARRRPPRTGRCGCRRRPG